MTHLRVRPEAELDALEAGVWYEREREGLGGAFLQTLKRVLARIERSPTQFPLVTTAIRRAMLGRFPYGVFFVVEEQVSTVIAVMHLHRHPASWQRRR